MSQLFSNNASATLSIQAEIIDLTLTLQTNEGQLFPSPTGADFFLCALEDTSGNIEIVQCTDNTSDVLTVVRAQESTSAKIFPTGSKVECRMTAGTHDSFLQVFGDVMEGELDMDDNQLTDPLIVGGEARNMPLRGTDGGTANQIVVPTAGADPTLGGDVIYHAGNDGAGSGLDADLLDGVQGSGYIKTADDPVTVTGDWAHTGAMDINGPVTTADEGTGGTVQDGTDNKRPLGFNVMPIFEQDSSDNFDLAHNGMVWHKDSAGAVTYTCADDSDIPQGATYVIVNEDSEALTIADGVITLRWMDGQGITPPTGDRTLAEAGVCTVYKYSDTEFWIWGNGLT